MKNQKPLTRAIALACLFLLLALAFSACGNKDNGNKAKKSAGVEAAEESEAPQTAPQPPPPPARDPVKEAADAKKGTIDSILADWKKVFVTGEQDAWSRQVRGGATLCELQGAWYDADNLVGRLDSQNLADAHIALSELPGVDVEKAKAHRLADLKAYTSALISAIEKGTDQGPCSVSGEGDQLDPGDKLELAKLLEAIFTENGPKPAEISLTAEKQRQLILIGLLQKVEQARKENKPGQWQAISNTMGAYNFSPAQVKLTAEETAALPKPTGTT